MKQKKILIIEDDIDLAKMVENYLTREKYNVMICQQGDQALHVVKE